MTIHSLSQSIGLARDRARLSKAHQVRLKELVPDLLAVTILIILPLVVFWAFWAPNPADRLMVRGDALMQGYPSRFFVHRLFNTGQLPLWNPYQLSGMPLLGDVQVAVFYLPNLLLDWLYLGSDIPYTAFEGLIVAHYVLGGLFFFAYLRHLKVGTAAALVGSIAFQFNGFFVGHRGHYNMLGVVVWVPGVVWLLDRAWQAITLRTKVWWTMLAGLALSQMIMAGHPQLAMYSGLFIAGYFFFRWQAVWSTWPTWWQSSWSGRWRQPLVHIPAVFGAAGILAVGLSAVALLPTAELLGRSMRSEPTYAFSIAYSLLPRNFINLLIPEFLDWSSTEFRIYAGILTLVLAMVTWMVSSGHQAERRFYTIVLVVATVVAMGGFTALQAVIYRYLPGFAMVRVSARAFYFANFALAVLAAFGAEVLFRPLSPSNTLQLKKLARYLRGVLIIAILVAAVLYLLLAWFYESPDESFYTQQIFIPATPQETVLFLTQMANQYLLFVFFLLGATVLLRLRRKMEKPGPGFVIAAGLLMTLDVTTFAPYHDTVRANPDEAHFTIKDFRLALLEEPWQIQEQQLLLAQLESLSHPIRVDNTVEVLPDNYSQVWGIPFSSGYNILDLQDRFELRTQWPYLSNTQVWDLFHVGYVLTSATEITPPEAEAQVVLDNSQGKIWQRARQPKYANFSTRIRVVNNQKTVRGFISTFPQTYQNQPAVSIEDDTAWETLANNWPDTLAPSRYQIGQTGQVSPVDITVLAGRQKGYSAIIVDGVAVTPEQRGMVLAGIDPRSGQVLESDVFDTYLLASESNRLAAAINAIEPGTIVALATYDQGTRSLTDNARAALATLGAKETLRDNFGQIYGLVGVKGSPAGTALEQVSSTPVVLDIGLGAASPAPEASFNYNLVTYQPNQITLLVENGTAGLLTISEAAYPGWTAFVDGRPVPILKANGLFQAIILPPTTTGQAHEVTFVYDPLTFRLGGTISIVTLALVVGLLAVSAILAGGKIISFEPQTGSRC